MTIIDLISVVQLQRLILFLNNYESKTNIIRRITNNSLLGYILYNFILYTMNYLETIINDIEIVIDAILNKDYKDAVNMLKDIQEDLKIIEELNK